MNSPQQSSGLAVLFGLAPTGLTVARSLGQNGVTVYGVDKKWYEVAHFSRWVKHDGRISHLAPGDDLLTGLLSFGRQCETKPVVFISADAYIDFIARHRAQLEEFYILPDSMSEAVNCNILDKGKLYEFCGRTGIAAPRTWFPAGRAEAQDVAPQVHYPAILKPTKGYLIRRRLKGKKLVEVRDAKELVSWWQTFERWGSAAVIQELIEGPEANIVVAGLYMDRNLTCRSLFTANKNRQHPPMYGSGSYMEAAWRPEIAELSIGIAQKLRYHGICGTEFKWDTRDQQWKLIEVNCRPTLWFALTRACGVDVVWDAYCDLIGRPNPVHIGCQKEGIRWQFLVRDVASALFFLRRGELSLAEFIRTVLDPRRKVEAVISVRDIKATCAYPLYTAMQIWVNFVRGGTE